MNIFVVGGAGLAGSHLVDAFLKLGAKVVVYDDLSTGQENFLADAQKSPGFVQLIRGDVRNLSKLTHDSFGADVLVHMAAADDVAATVNVLEVCRYNSIRRLVYPSSDQVYGAGAYTPTHERAALSATSLYAASKIAGEAMVQAYCAEYGLQAVIFRMASLLGERYTRGMVADYVRKMRADTPDVEIPGTGTARQDYLYAGDMAAAVMKYFEKVSYAKGRYDVYNLGTGRTATLNSCVGWIAAELGLHPEYTYAPGPDDSPSTLTDTARIRSLGWEPTLSIEQAVRVTAAWVSENTK